MSIWLDGLFPLHQYSWTVFSIVMMIIWGQIVIQKALVALFNERLSATEYFSLSMAGWILPVMLWSALFFICVCVFGNAAGYALFIILIAAPFCIFFNRIKHIFLPAHALILLTVILIVLRLSFLQKIVMPPYFDSAEHYRIIKQFLETMWISTEIYYHTGYHVLVAAFSRFFDLEISSIMLVFGQIILSTLPASLYFIARHETKSDVAGVFVALLAGLGWHMPSHVVNWGKYPALLNLVSISFVVSLGYAMWRVPLLKPRPGFFFLLAGISLSGLTHTRSLVVFTCMALAAFFVLIVKRVLARGQVIAFGFVMLFLAIEIGFIQNNATLSPLLEGYWRNDIWLLCLTLILMFFAAIRHTDFTLFLTTSTALFLLALFIPLELPGYGTLTILDRPYVQMLIHMPLSLFGGLGLAGLLQWIRRIFPRSSLPAHLMMLSVFGLIAVNAGLNHNFYPSDCCQFVKHDDLAALTWMDASLPKDVSILIASESFYVTSLEEKGARVGVDGGIWIEPLTSRKTILAWSELDFFRSEVHYEICKRRLGYIYAGGMPKSFDHAMLEGLPEWYGEVFALPNAKIYQVNGCK